MHQIHEAEVLGKLPKSGLSDLDVLRLWLNKDGFWIWRSRHRLAFQSPEVQDVVDRALDLLERGVLDSPAEPVEPEGYSKVFRADAQALCDFVNTVRRLPTRMGQVFALCVQEGLSLNECAKRLGISRETVRVHLRRLRQLRRRYLG